MVEEEIQDILDEDKRLRGGLNGILSGFRWTSRPDPEKLRQQIIDREEALRIEAKGRP